MACTEVWKAAHPEKHREHSRRSMSRWRKGRQVQIRTVQLRIRYGLTPLQYNRLFTAQNGVCAICGQPETARQKSGKIQRLSIDHNHKCCPGKRSCGRCVRGLLCVRCNIALGSLSDDVTRMYAMISYITRTEAL